MPTLKIRFINDLNVLLSRKPRNVAYMSLWIMNEINKRFLKDLFNLEMGSHRTLVTEQGDIQPNAVNDFSKTPS